MPSQRSIGALTSPSPPELAAGDWNAVAPHLAIMSRKQETHGHTLALHVLHDNVAHPRDAEDQASDGRGHQRSHLGPASLDFRCSVFALVHEASARRRR